MEETVVLSEKAEEWQERIRSQAESGQKVPEFCKDRQVKRENFYYWRKRFRNLSRKDLKGESSAGRFIPLTGKGLNSRVPRIHLPNGVEIELGAGLESGAVTQLIRDLCGVGHLPKDGYRAKS